MQNAFWWLGTDDGGSYIECRDHNGLRLQYSRGGALYDQLKMENGILYFNDKRVLTET